MEGYKNCMGTKIVNFTEKYESKYGWKLKFGPSSFKYLQVHLKILANYLPLNLTLWLSFQL